jgi:peptidoglycan/xylan/chitin deacetylase (PgdA/CDA1 family)
MSLPDSYLRYEKRHRGMDHDRYEWSALPHRKKVVWPEGAKVALFICPAIEFFPLNMSNKPFAPPGAMSKAYPDLRHYTLRDYGNRVGIYRLMEVLDSRSLRVSAAIDAACAVRYPSLMAEVARRGWEVIAHGVDRDHLHHGGMDQKTEASWIDQTLTTLETATGKRPRGWLSPAKSQSSDTPDLLASRSIEYMCDWSNDDMPYMMKTSSGPICCMPHSADIDDYSILVQDHQSEDEFTTQLIDQFNVLYAESDRQGGRIMSIALRPWVIGQPYRISALEAALDHILSHDRVWSATASEIVDAWRAE